MPDAAPLLFRLLGFELLLLLLVCLPVLAYARQFAVAARLAAGGVCVLVAAVLFGARDSFEFEASPILAQAFVLSGAGFVYRCLTLLYALPRALLWEVVSPLVGFVAFLLLWALDTSAGRTDMASARVVAVALPMAAFPLSWLYRLHKRRPRVVTIGTWYLVIGAGVAAFGSLARGVAFTVQPMPDPLHSPFGVVAAAVAMATSLLMTSGLMLEGTARAQWQLRASNAQLQRDANTDALTGVGNRRFFESAALASVAAARDDGHAVCVLMLDIDNFKVVNDRYGHEAGDEVLRQIAVMAAGQLRSRDLLARWGGEEFSVLLVGADVAEASSVGERLLRGVRALTVSAIEGQPLTVSVGLTRLEPNESLAEAQRRADAALYQAKTLGRDRLALAS